MRRWLAVMMLAAALGTPSCAKQQTKEGASPVIDESLMAWLSRARSLHHEADMLEDKGDLRGAIAALERVVAGPSPGRAPEVDEVSADTRARLADMRSRAGDVDRALEDITAGLLLVPSASYYRGHLIEVRGTVEERLAKALTAKGDKDGAAKAKEKAMASYEEAISVQDQVIARGSADGGAK